MKYLKFYYSESINPLHKFGDKVIKEVQRTNFSHFAIGLLDSETGIEIIYESIFPKSRRLLKDQWLNDYSPVLEMNLKISDERFNESIWFLDTMIDKWYSLKQIFWIAFIGWFKIKTLFSNKVTINSKNKLICTEMGYIYCKEFFNFDHDENSDSVDLNDMLKIGKDISSNPIWK